MNGAFRFSVSSIRIFAGAAFVLIAISTALFGALQEWQEPELEYSRRLWQTEDGLQSPVVRALMQGSSGYLWLATEEGLTRFDGRRFADFDTRTVAESHSRWMVDLVETSDGSIWTSSRNGGVTRLRDGKLTRYTTEDGLNSDFVMALHEDRQGRLWVGTAK